MKAIFIVCWWNKSDYSELRTEVKVSKEMSNASSRNLALKGKKAIGR